MLYYLYKLYFDDFQECYIGISKDIEKRIEMHKRASNNRSKKHMKLYNFINENKLNDKIKCEVLKELIVDTMKEAKVEERRFIELLKPYLNTLLPNRTGKEYYEKFKKEIYFKRNIQNLSRREKNKKKCLEHYYKNKEKRQQYMKEWRKKNGAKYLEKRQRRVTCLCGKDVSYATLKSHIQSKNHKKKCLEKILCSKQKLIYRPKNICIKI
mgnify:CR=1 FL=1